MRVRAAALAGLGAVLVLSGCGTGARTRTAVHRTVVAPRLRALQVARSSDDRFSIFPPKPGSKYCIVPGGGMMTRPLRGRCQTVVFAQGPRFVVAFTERWGNGVRCRKGVECPLQRTWHHTWAVSASTTRVFATRESGVQDPATWK